MSAGQWVRAAHSMHKARVLPRFGPRLSRLCFFGVANARGKEPSGGRILDACRILRGPSMARTRLEVVRLIRARRILG